jgi:hypothetical protein
VLKHIEKLILIVNCKQQLLNAMLKLVQRLIKGKKRFVVDLKAGRVKEVELLEKDGVVQDFK